MKAVTAGDVVMRDLRFARWSKIPQAVENVVAVC